MKTFQKCIILMMWVMQSLCSAQTIEITSPGVKYGNMDLDMIYFSPEKSVENAIGIPGADYLTKSGGTIGYRANSVAPAKRLLCQIGCVGGGSYDPAAATITYISNCTGRQFVMLRYSKWSEEGFPVVININGKAQSFTPVNQGSWETFAYSDWMEFDFPQAELSLAPQVLNFEAITNLSKDFSVASNSSWKAKVSEPWLGLNTYAGAGDANVVVSAEANENTEIRTAEIIVTAGSSEKNILVSQTGVVLYLNVAPSALNVLADANAKEALTIGSNGSWKITSDQAWLTISQASGTGNAIIDVTASANTSTASRTAILAVSAGELVKLISIQQAGTACYLNTSSNSVNLNADALAQETLTISSNCAWSIACDKSWLTVSSLSGSGTADIILTASANSTTNVRTATLTISSNNLLNVVSIYQKGTAAYLEVSTDKMSLQADANASESFAISSNSSWQASSTQSWLTVSPSSGTKNTTVEVSASANIGSTSRTAVVNIVSGTLEKSITVQQAGMTYQLTVLPASLTLPAESGASAFFTITSNSTWYANSDADWLKFTPSTGTGNASIALAATSANQTQYTRQAVIVITDNGMNRKEVLVEQQADVQTRFDTLELFTLGQNYGVLNVAKLWLSTTNQSKDGAFVIDGWEPASASVGEQAYRSNAETNAMGAVWSNIGCESQSPWGKKTGAVRYLIPHTQESPIFICIRYSKYSSSSVPVEIIINGQKLADWYPQNQSSWNVFDEDWIDLSTKSMQSLSLNCEPYEKHIDVNWSKSSAARIEKYRIYKKIGSSGYQPAGEEKSLNKMLYIGEENRTVQLKITALNAFQQPVDSAVTTCTTKQSFTDEKFLRMIQKESLKYFWDFAHPASGFIRDRSNGDDNVCGIGATGMGIMVLVTACENNFLLKDAVERRILKVLTSLKRAESYHGAFPHWVDGETGKAVWENKADLVETAYLAQGLLTARQYFSTNTEIVKLADALWKAIDWNFFLNQEDHLHWHWSPEEGFAGTFSITGYHEAQITYLLALISPTHPIPHEVYKTGWMGKNYASSMQDPCTPLFFSHYSYLGFDPRTSVNWNLPDTINYFSLAVRLAKADHDYCAEAGYPTWGLTASDDASGYEVHAPCSEHDNGTLTPSASLASMPFLPDQAIESGRFMYNNLGDSLWGNYGFKDAFDIKGWYANGYIGIDQAPVVVMIENHLTGLLWKTCMSAPEWKSLFSQPTLVHEEKTTTTALFPNPCNDYVVIQSACDPSNPAELSIYNAGGILIKHLRLSESKVRINTASWEKGIYCYTIRSDSKTVTGKFVKN